LEKLDACKLLIPATLLYMMRTRRIFIFQTISFKPEGQVAEKFARATTHLGFM